MTLTLVDRRGLSKTQKQKLPQSELHSPSEPPPLRRPRAAYRVHRIRGDTVGALVTILDNAPYGPNVDEAKVTTDELGMLLSLTVLRSRISRCRRS
jgi:hypothetical protein